MVTNNTYFLVTVPDAADAYRCVKYFLMAVMSSQPVGYVIHQDIRPLVAVTDDLKKHIEDQGLATTTMIKDKIRHHEEDAESSQRMFWRLVNHKIVEQKFTPVCWIFNITDESFAVPDNPGSVWVVKTSFYLENFGPKPSLDPDLFNI